MGRRKLDQEPGEPRREQRRAGGATSPGATPTIDCSISRPCRIDSGGRTTKTDSGAGGAGGQGTGMRTMPQVGQNGGWLCSNTTKKRIKRKRVFIFVSVCAPPAHLPSLVCRFVCLGANCWPARAHL